MKDVEVLRKEDCLRREGRELLSRYLFTFLHHLHSAFCASFIAVYIRSTPLISFPSLVLKICHFEVSLLAQ